MKEKTNENIILLNLIYQNAQMGLIGIDTVLPKVENEKLASLMQKQRCEYEEFCKNVKKILIKYGAQEEEIGKLKELSSTMMSKMMVMNADDKKIAKLMMEGNDKGVIAIQEKLNADLSQDEEIINLAKKLLATEEHNINEMKEFI